MVGAGTQTTALPAAMAGANSSAPIVYGQFHGLTTAITPSGTRVARIRLAADVEAGSPPSRRLASSPAIRKYSASSSTSSYASASSGLPWSSVKARASSSRRPVIPAMICWQQAARSNGEAAAQPGQAARPAATASSTSAGVPVATEAKVSPEAGLTAAAGLPRPARQAPSMYSRCSRTMLASVLGLTPLGPRLVHDSAQSFPSSSRRSGGIR